MLLERGGPPGFPEFREDPIFLIPWWIIGVTIHGWGFRFIPVLTIWAPLATMLGFVLWTVRMQSNAARELQALPEAKEE